MARAADLLCSGALVSFPTETVYGLGADATNDTAVARIFEAKGRPHFNPLIVHLPSVEAVFDYAVLDGVARDLAMAFWPGPLTLVLPLKPDGPLSALVSAGLPTVA
ncbi:L-threonylcarbamoyladenylate synthase, partial [Gelidibacter sp. F2691]|nr:L-threonylcarbamoyladenylate synthase [Gelidibacter sp. F2691]